MQSYKILCSSRRVVSSYGFWQFYLTDKITVRFKFILWADIFISVYCAGNSVQNQVKCRNKKFICFINYTSLGTLTIVQNGTLIHSFLFSMRIELSQNGKKFIWRKPLKCAPRWSNKIICASFITEKMGSCHKRQKPQAPIRNRQTRKVANAKGLNRNTNLT